MFRSQSPREHLRTRVALAFVAVALACMHIPMGAYGSETAKIKVAFMPYTLGRSTAISSVVTIGTTDGSLPSPLVKFNIRFPSSLTGLISNLGLAICSPTLLEIGPEYCPTNSLLGTGYVHAGLFVAGQTITEKAEVDVFMGPPRGEQIGVLVYTATNSPLQSQTIFQGELVSGTGDFGELLEAKVPLVETWPEGNDVVMTYMQLSIDPSTLRYHRHFRGTVVSYHPRGFELPQVCPAGGFPFNASLVFSDGTQISAADVIPCPKSYRRRRKNMTADMR